MENIFLLNSSLQFLFHLIKSIDFPIRSLSFIAWDAKMHVTFFLSCCCWHFTIFASTLYSISPVDKSMFLGKAHWGENLRFSFSCAWEEKIATQCKGTSESSQMIVQILSLFMGAWGVAQICSSGEFIIANLSPYFLSPLEDFFLGSLSLWISLQPECQQERALWKDVCYYTAGDSLILLSLVCWLGGADE